MKIQKKYFIIFLLVITFGVFLFQYNQIEKVDLYQDQGKEYVQAVVTDIIQDNKTESGNIIGKQLVQVSVLSGRYAGETLEATSSSSYLYGTHCEVGMKVIVVLSESDTSLFATVYSYDRTPIIIMIVVLFLLVLWVVGRKQGLYSGIGIVFTFICIVFLFLPMIYKGYSPILSAIIVSFLSTLVTMFLIGGISTKTLTAIIGTLLGVIISGIFAFVFSSLSHISGYNVNEIEQLVYVQQMTSVNIGELMYAGILISSLGAIMDVAMSVSSTIHEIYGHNAQLTMKELFQSGMNVGKDMMGTMSNTLILAFAGGSINTLVFLYCYDYSFLQMMNMYSIGIEIIQGVSATLGVILTVPIVSLIVSYLLTKKA